MINQKNLEYGIIRDDELDAVSAIVVQALFFPPTETAPWLRDELGMQQVRTVRVNGKPAASIAIIPMGQWFGGVSVPSGCITAVGVVPEQRGSGVGLLLMRRSLEDLHDAGTPLSALYPATTAFYRRAGYERASTRTIYEFWPNRINVRDYTLDVVAVEPGHEDELRRVYTQRARVSSGQLDRHASLWKNLHSPTGQTIYRYLVTRDGQAEGYIAFNHSEHDKPLNVRDICALTPDAGRRLLTLLADHRSMVEKVRWSGAPNDPLHFLMPEQQYKVESSFDLLVRIVDVAGALSARGYPPGLETELHFEVRDELLPWNNGRFVLSISDGRGSARQGGQGRIRLHVRDLAALYSGYMTPQELRVAGTLDADAANLAQAAQVFAGPRPWTPDMF